MTADVIAARLDRAPVHEVDLTLQDRLEGGFHVETGVGILDSREVHHEIGVASRRIEIDAASRRPEHVQTRDMEPLAGGSELIALVGHGGCIGSL